MLATLLFCCLVINEIAYAPPNQGSEYVELFNAGASVIDLADATLYDSTRRPRPVVDRSLTLKAGAYVVLVQDPTAFEASFPGVPFLPVSGWPTLNNTGDEVGISVGGVEVDLVAYQPDWSNSPAPLERIDPQGPSSHPVNWTSSPTGGTPGAINAAYRPDRDPPRMIYAERFLTDSLLVVFSEPVVPVGAAAFGARSVRWSNDSTAWAAGSPPGPARVQGVEDLFGNRTSETGMATVGLPETGEVIITERLLRPVSDPFDGVPDQTRFVELWNAGKRAVSVRGLRLQGAV
ncbi:MAG: lamin tail domain-containing protein, partial [Rhodothermales bacterium]|nr:lamin tail domain-containing protein [Rhodothermales bacterium]